MSSVEILKWKQFFILTFKLMVIVFIFSLIFCGFSSTVWSFSLKASLYATLFSFFWVFCARDENG